MPGMLGMPGMLAMTGVPGMLGMGVWGKASRGWDNTSELWEDKNP